MHSSIIEFRTIDSAIPCAASTRTYCSLFRREVFDRIGLYDPLLIQEDYDLYLRLALDYEIAFLNGPPLADYRVHGGQTDDEELTRGQIQTARKHLALLAARTDVRDARRARRNFNLMLARSHRILGERRQARAAAFRAAALGAPQALRFAR